MAMSAISGVWYFQPALGAVDVLSRFKTAIEGIDYKGQTLRPMDSSRELWDAGGEELGRRGAWLTHDVLAAEQGAQFAESDVHYRLERGFNLGKLEMMSFVLPETPAGAAMSWSLMSHLLPHSISVIDPDLAMINGNEDVAWGSDLVPGALPAFFTPFTYLGPTRLTDERRRALGALPDCRTEKLGDGWVVQAVTDLHQKVSPAFVSALAAMPNEKPIRYKQSRPPRDKTVGSKSR